MAGMAEVAAEKNNIIQTIKSYGNQLFGFIRSRVPTNEDAERYFAGCLVPVE
jgi:hypothetical protein